MKEKPTIIRLEEHLNWLSTKVTLYHVTKEGNIPDIIEAGGLTPDVGGTGGLAAMHGEYMVKNSKEKVFVSTHWAGVVSNVDWLRQKNEEPVILKISLPLNPFLRYMKKDMDTEFTDEKGDTLEGEEREGFLKLGAYFLKKMKKLALMERSQWNS